MPIVWWTVGCAEPALPDRVVVVQRADDGEYLLAPRDRAGLADPRRLTGDLGVGFSGGRLRVDGYLDGGALDIPYAIEQGDGVPLDAQGLVLWSFWYHLDDARDALEARGVDVSPIFPVNVAWTPQSVLDFAAVENAAFVLGQNTFVLFPDALDTLPVAANAGVVRHEFGHSLFELVVTGKSGGDIAWIDAPSDQQSLVRALNEGFADMVATLTLDDPRFIDPSLPQPSRDVEGDAVATPSMYPSADAGDLASLTYDPYALGTVYASLVWDVRRATDDPDATLALALDALAAWGETEAWGDPDQFALELIERAAGPQLPAACDAAAARLPHLTLPGSCT
ncbi:MAG: hypothetical protein ABMA64_15965 [Myxococcota bacterium]